MPESSLKFAGPSNYNLAPDTNFDKSGCDIFMENQSIEQGDISYPLLVLADVSLMLKPGVVPNPN